MSIRQPRKALKPYQWTNRQQRRVAEVQSMRNLKQQAQPLLQDGSPQALQSLRQLTTATQQAEAMANYRASLRAQVKDTVEKGGGFWGKVKDVAGDVGSTTLDVLDAPRKYVGAPIAGQAIEGVKAIRDADSPMDAIGAVAKSINPAAVAASAFTPEGNRRGRESYEEQKAKLPVGLQVASDIAVDPTTWIGPGLIKGAATRVAPRLLTNSRAVRAAATILEQPARVGIGQVIGGGVGAGIGDELDLPGPARAALTIGGAIAGGGIGGARGIGAVKDVDTVLANVQGRAGKPAVVGLGITDETPNLERYTDALNRHQVEWKVEPDGRVSADPGSAEEAISRLNSEATEGLYPMREGGIRADADAEGAYMEMFGKVKQKRVKGQQGTLAPGKWIDPGHSAHDAMDDAERLGEILAEGEVSPLREAMRSEPWQPGDMIRKPISDSTRSGYEANPSATGNRALGVDDADRLANQYVDGFTPARSARALTAQAAYLEEAFKEQFGRSLPARQKAMLQRLDEIIEDINTKGRDARFLDTTNPNLAADASRVSKDVTKQIEWKDEFDRLVEGNYGKNATQIARHQGIDPQSLPFEFPEFRAGLTKMDKAMNALKRGIGVGVEEDPIATPAMRARARMRPIIESQAAIIGARSQASIDEVFTRNAAGQIVDLPGKPTVQDLAAKLPNYEAMLTPEQIAVLRDLERMIAPYRTILEEGGVVIDGVRSDVIEGGFYLPRKVDFSDAPKKVSSGRYLGAGGKRGFEKEAVYESMAQGIAAGETYEDIGAALSKYASEAGRRAMDQYTADYFKTLEMDGTKLGTSYADRINVTLRDEYQEQVKKLASIRRKLATAEKNAGVLADTSDELDTAILAFAEIDFPAVKPLASEAAKQRRTAERLRSTPSRTVLVDPKGNVKAVENEMRADTIERVVKAFEDQLPDSLDYADAVDGAFMATSRRIAALEKRGLKWRKDASDLKAQLGRAEAKMNDLAPRYKKAVREAQRGQRDKGSIGFVQLMGRQFPTELSNAANKWLQAERPPMGRGAGTVQTVEALNSLLRGLRATADVSFMGIQGLFGAVRDPIGYGQAVKIAYLSAADPNALGSYIKQFDNAKPQQGRLASNQWAKVGLHIGGADHEFAIDAANLTNFGQHLTRKAVPGTQGVKIAGKGAGGVNPLRGANRMFGYFGDSMRLELADTILESAIKRGQPVDDALLRQIASSANRATGWSPNTFAGEVGQLAQFAPRFFQSQLEMVAKAFTDGTLEGAEARRMMGSLFGAAVTLAVAGNTFSPDGLPPEKVLSPFRDPKDPTKGWNSNFLRVRFNGTDYSMLGPWDSLLRGTIETSLGLADAIPGVEAQGSPTYFLRSKASPVLGAMWDLLSGENMIGDKTRTPEYLLRSFLPFTVNDIGRDTFTAEGLGRMGVGATGIKATPLSPTENLDTVARAQFGNDFWKIERSQQQQIKEEHPDLWQRYVEGSRGQRQRAEAVKAELEAQQAASDAQFLSGTMTREDWITAMKSRRAEQTARMKEIYGDGEIRSGDRVLDGYYRAIDDATDPETKQVNWDAVDAWMSGQSPEDQDYIDRNTGLGGTPLVKLYRELTSQYYDLPRYQGFTADQAYEIDAAWTEIRNRAGDDRRKQLRFIREMQAQLGFSDEVATALRKRAFGRLKETKDREQWKRANPQSAIFLGSGRLTPAEMAAL